MAGRRFDPRMGRVVGTTQDMTVGSGIVMEEVSAGFQWDDELLRVAEVIVNRSARTRGDCVMADEIVGIDLGTTNSEIARRIATAGRRSWPTSRAARSCLGRRLSPKPGSFWSARRRATSGCSIPSARVRSIKRRMGQDETVRMAEHDYTPQEISAIILRR